MDGRKLSEKRFRIMFMLLRVGGLPIYLENVTILYKLYIGFVMFSKYYILMVLLVDSITKRDDLKSSMNSARIVPSVCTFLWSSTYISMFRGSFDRLLRLTEQFTWEELPTRDPKTGETTMAGFIGKILTTSKYAYLGVLFFHTSQSSYGILTNHQLMFDTWNPFDTSVSPNYQLIILFQFYTSHVLLCIFAGSNALYCVVIAIACSQLEKIKISLLNLKQNQDMEEQLNQCIRHHQQTLEFMDEIEKSLCIYICGEMFVLFSGLCINAFSAVTSWGDHSDVIQGLGGYLILMAQLFVICWFGTKLTEKAESVREAAWECDWVGTAPSLQKSVMFIIARANKIFTLTAGKFVPVSNETLLNIMNESLSFFMFLLHVKDRNENQNEDTHMETQYIQNT